MQADDGSPSLRSSINVTPLADVMLVLLIIFMVVTPMMESGVEVRLPRADHASEHPDDEETLVVSLKGDKTVYLGEEKMSTDELVSALTSMLSERTDDILWVKANEGLDFGYVLEMMDRCRSAGATEVALITKAAHDDNEPDEPDEPDESGG